MSTLENIYLYTGGLTPDEVAGQIANVIEAEVAYGVDNAIVKRELSQTPDGWVKCAVAANPFHADPPNQENPSATDLYDIACNLWCPSTEEAQRSQAAQIFAQITGELPWPALLIHNEDQLISAWAPAIGRTDFPPGTTPDEEHLDLWTPFADPAAIAHQEPGSE